MQLATRFFHGDPLDPSDFRVGVEEILLLGLIRFLQPTSVAAQLSHSNLIFSPCTSFTAFSN